MAGYTKHIFEKEILQIKDDLSKYLNEIIPLLPYEYDINVVKALVQKYYPYEWLIIDEKYKYYCIKEAYLIRQNKKSRYRLDEPSTLLKKISSYKKIISHDYVGQHQSAYNEKNRVNLEADFKARRNPKIIKIYNKIIKAKLKMQQVEPEYIDKLMGLYDRKSTTQKDKVYILHELKKYYCSKTLTFFSKKVDIEYNIQLRRMAFEHIQSLGFQPVLRKQKYMIIHSKNKKRREFLKKVYANENYNIKAIPDELEYRIKNSKEQSIKSYDYFISHSSLDYKVVQKLIQDLNFKNKNIYCDWVNDDDYLKRKLVGGATLEVIKKRLQQSKIMIFVISDNSLNSKWCNYELNYNYELGKPIYTIKKEELIKGRYELELNEKQWFLDKDYMKTKLF